MPVKMDEIARLAGVSRPTVSKALAGKDRVSADTRNRILEIAQQMNFVPSGTAQALGRGATQMVGVYYSHGGLPGPWSMTVLGGVDRALRSSHHHLIVITKTIDEEVPRVVRQQFVDAMLVVHSREPRLESFLRDRRIPFVVANAGKTSDCDYVMPDNFHAAHLAVQHLVQLGHRRIGFVGTPTPMHVSAQERALGYAEAIANAGLVALPGYSDHTPVADRIRQLLAMTPRPTAMVCYNDDVAMEAISFLQRIGVSVPGQMSVVGFDDLNPAVQFFNAPLTTVRMPFEEIGAKAAELLMRRLRKPEATRKALVLTEEMQLVVRASTARFEPD